MVNANLESGNLVKMNLANCIQESLDTIEYRTINVALSFNDVSGLHRV